MREAVVPVPAAVRPPRRLQAAQAVALAQVRAAAFRAHRRVPRHPVVVRFNQRAPFPAPAVRLACRVHRRPPQVVAQAWARVAARRVHPHQAVQVFRPAHRVLQVRLALLAVAHRLVRRQAISRVRALLRHHQAQVHPASHLRVPPHPVRPIQAQAIQAIPQALIHPRPAIHQVIQIQVNRNR